MRKITINSLIFRVFTYVISKEPYRSSCLEYIGMNWYCDLDEIEGSAFVANLNLGFTKKKDTVYFDRQRAPQTFSTFLLMYR